MKHIDAAQKARIIATVRAAAVATATMWDELNLAEAATATMWDELELAETATHKFVGISGMLNMIATELDSPPDGSKISDASIWESIEGCWQITG